MGKRSGVDPKVRVTPRFNSGPKARDGLVAHNLPVAAATFTPVVSDRVVWGCPSSEEQRLRLIGHLMKGQALRPNEVQPSHFQDASDMRAELCRSSFLVPVRARDCAGLTNAQYEPEL
jgi:hypothetical protein